MAEEYKSESWLREKYWDEGKSQREIAKELDVCARTVSKWMSKNNIKKRSSAEAHSDGDSEKLRDKEWLIEQYKHQEKSTEVIANELKVSASTVRRWMNKHNIDTRPKSDGDVEKLRNEEWLREQYENQQKSTYEIADELGVSPRTVLRWVRKHGIETRSISESRFDSEVGEIRDEKWLREQYKHQEKSTTEIADELGISSRTVSKWMRKHGIETRSISESQSDGDVEKLMDGEWLREQYKHQEKSTTKISNELDVPGRTVLRWMRKHGIETRPKSDGDVEKLRDGEWLIEQYKHQKKSTYEIADELGVSQDTVTRWLENHKISVRSSTTNPEHTTHIVRSEWELEVCNLLIEMGVNYDYESIKIEYGDGNTYYPDFVTNKYVIEVKGAYFGEIHRDKNTGREKALATMENLSEKDYVVVGKELPADIHIPWEERSKIRELFSGT